MLRLCPAILFVLFVLGALVGCTPSVDTTPGTGKVVGKDDIKKMDGPEKPPEKK